MKKLWLMLLVGCTMGAFSACSDGDDGEKPKCPITEYKVPATAEIGGNYTITGNGFDAAAQLFLAAASGEETAVSDTEVSSTGITCTIPSTLAPGVYDVIVKQGGSWKLGSVRLSEAQNPVSGVVLPKAIKLNKVLAIDGNGFTADSKIFLVPAAAETAPVELKTEVSPTGVNCTIPEGVAPGLYNVVLKYNNIDWVLGEKIEAAVYKRLKEFRIVQSDVYDTDKMDKVAFREMVKQMVEADGTQVTEAELDEHVAMYMSFFQSGEHDLVHELYVYNKEGRPTAVQKPSAEGNMVDWYTFSYDGDRISATNLLFDEYAEVKSFVWTMNGSSVESETVDFGGRTTDFKWLYDESGYCTGLNYISSGKAYAAFEYVKGNLANCAVQSTALPTELFQYKDVEKKCNIFSVDVAKSLMCSALGYASMTEDFLFANAFGWVGKSSANLPSAVVLSEELTQDMAGTMDADNYPVSVKWLIEGMDPLFGMCPYRSETSVLFVYE